MNEKHYSDSKKYKLTIVLVYLLAFSIFAVLMYYSKEPININLGDILYNYTPDILQILGAFAFVLVIYYFVSKYKSEVTRRHLSMAEAENYAKKTALHINIAGEIWILGIILGLIVYFYYAFHEPPGFIIIAMVIMFIAILLIIWDTRRLKERLKM